LNWSTGGRPAAVIPGLTFAAAAAAGIALRVWLYRSALGIPNSDEAVVGLMARHMIDGQFATFFWGQAYGGSQEALLAVPGFVIAGSGWLALRAIPLVLFLATLVLVWRIGLRTIGPRAASVAVALYWIWPSFVIYVLTHELGFYGSDVFYCALVLLLALRLAEQPDRARAGLLGLVAGLAFWQTSQIVPIIVAVVAWIVWTERGALRRLWIALIGAAIGASPWLAWNLTHGWASLSLPSGAETSYEHRLRVFFSPVLPMMLGLRTPVSQKPLLPSAALVDAIYVALLALFLVGAYRARHRPASLLYVVAAVYPFVYGLASQTFDSSDPRYVVVLTPVLSLLAAQLMTGQIRALVILAGIAVVSLVTLQRLERLPTRALTSAALPTAPRNLEPLVSTLDGLHLDRVYAPYLLAYVLDFDTKERIVAVEAKFDDVEFVGGQAVLPHHPSVRQPAYLREVAAAPRRGIVLFRTDIGTVPIIGALERHGFRRTAVGPFVVFSPPG
jgi:hypothetical protein